MDGAIQNKRPLEMWGGLECTVNRVGEVYHDQLVMNGHETRIEDLEMFRDLGIRTLRYPLLWEKVCPKSLDECDWSLPDERLQKLRELGITPILTLVHHGSGPRYTSLTDSEFGHKLALFAAKVAERYPWLEYFTPVNEPLTTARFSGLYGVWYPHGSDDKTFCRALYNEIYGTALAMQAIRKSIPNAKLVQTDDLGRASGTYEMRYQVEFENDRRWLTFDLLCGRVDRKHCFRDYLQTRGELKSDELDWLAANPSPPDMIGINHYPLSNRFLDHRKEIYPPHMAATPMAYIDVGAVDTGQVDPPHAIEIYREAWERYHIPIAITEVHIGGYREGQMRWLKEVWDSAEQLRKEGADIRAVTVWSLLGAYDWISLCTAIPFKQHYESGIYDVRWEKPRPTALAKMVRSYAEGRTPDHPVLERSGYWHRPQRVLFAPEPPVSKRFADHKPMRPVIITGANGTLGRAFKEICDRRDIEAIPVTRENLDITSREALSDLFSAVKPWAVINAAGYVRIDDAERESEHCHRDNVAGPKALAEVCSDFAIPLLTFSSDHVFDGQSSEPYLEHHPVGPVNFYGRSKVDCENLVRELHPNSLIVRTSWLFGANARTTYPHAIATSLREGKEIRAAEDMIFSPTYLPDLVATCLDLLIDEESGIVHLANEGSISMADWARAIAHALDADPQSVVGVSTDELGYLARRPKYGVLASRRVARMMPSFESGFDRFIRDSRLKENS